MDEFRFSCDGVEVPNGRMFPVELGGSAPGIVVGPGVLRFSVAAWVEVLLMVQWDAAVTGGRRFAHSAVRPDGYPLHSEAIEADVLVELSGGRQLLRGNTRVGPGWVEEMSLEVWQDSGVPVGVSEASLVVRSFVPNLRNLKILGGVR